MRNSVARIAVSAATFAIDKPYDYLIPEEFKEKTVPGMRVIVPFGRGSRKAEGVVISLVSDSGQSTLKSIDSLLDDEPILNDENLRLALWMSDRFFCSVFEALRADYPEDYRPPMRLAFLMLEEQAKRPNEERDYREAAGRHAEAKALYQADDAEMAMLDALIAELRDHGWLKNDE